MAEIYIRAYTGPVFTASITDTVTYGSLVYHNGTDFALADADALTTPAQYICVGLPSIGTSRQGTMARKAVIGDADAPYTLGDLQYLSTTAGAITATRPTGDDDIVQIVGRAISTSQVEIDIQQPQERQVPLMHGAEDGTATASTAFDTAGGDVWVGTLLDADDEQAVVVVRLPDNILSIVEARWLFGADTAVTPSVGYTVNGAHEAEVSDVTTDSVTAAAITGTADALETDSLASGLDATGMTVPGHYVALKIDHGASGTDAVVSFGASILALVAS